MATKPRRVALCFPNFRWQRPDFTDWNTFPHALCILAAVIRDRYEVDIIDAHKEELSEVKETLQNDDLAHRQEEFGDLFFALINAARLYDIDPETALERTNKKFIRRFRHIESRAREQGKQLSDMPLAEMEEYWQEAKING